VKLLLNKFNKDDDQQTNELIRMAADKNGLLSADRLANRFMGQLKRCLHDCQQDACAVDNQVTEDDQDDESRLDIQEIMLSKMSFFRHQLRPKLRLNF